MNVRGGGFLGQFPFQVLTGMACKTLNKKHRECHNQKLQTTHDIMNNKEYRCLHKVRYPLLTHQWMFPLYCISLWCVLYANLTICVCFNKIFIAACRLRVVTFASCSIAEPFCRLHVKVSIQCEQSSFFLSPSKAYGTKLYCPYLLSFFLSFFLSALTRWSTVYRTERLTFSN